MSRQAGAGFGAHPFGEIARATVAAQERSLELAQAWTGSLQQLVTDQAEAARAGVNHPAWVMPRGLGPGIVDP